MARSHFGHIYERKGRPGFYVKFDYAGYTVRRYAGPTRRAAGDRLATAQLCKSKNMPYAEMLAQVFGDAAGDRITFDKAAELYLSSMKRTHKSSTCHHDAYRDGG